MGILWNFISFPHLSDMIIWSCTCFSIFWPHVQQILNNFHRLYMKFQRAYYSSFEIYFHYLKWVFRRISFRSIVWQIWSIKETYVCKIVRACLLRFNKHFLTLWTTTEQVLHMYGNLYSISQMGIWQNSISSPATKVMNRFVERHQLPTIFQFGNFIKSYCNFIFPHVKHPISTIGCHY